MFVCLFVCLFVYQTLKGPTSTFYGYIKINVSKLRGFRVKFQIVILFVKENMGHLWERDKPHFNAKLAVNTTLSSGCGRVHFL